MMRTTQTKIPLQQQTRERQVSGDNRSHTGSRKHAVAIAHSPFWLPVAAEGESLKGYFANSTNLPAPRRPDITSVVRKWRATSATNGLHRTRASRDTVTGIG